MMMPETPTIKRLQQRLQPLSPTLLEIIDESDQHIGHAHAPVGGGSHFKIVIASHTFAGKNRLQCHRLVYAALEGLIGREIHAVQLIVEPE